MNSAIDDGFDHGTYQCLSGEANTPYRPRAAAKTENIEYFETRAVLAGRERDETLMTTACSPAHGFAQANEFVHRA